MISYISTLVYIQSNVKRMIVLSHGERPWKQLSAVVGAPHDDDDDDDRPHAVQK